MFMCTCMIEYFIVLNIWHYLKGKGQVAIPGAVSASSKAICRSP